MACTSYHPATRLWLTSFGPDAKAGDTPTISVGHPLAGGEFTTYRLPEPTAQGDQGPLFDMSKADVELTMNTTPEDQVWASVAEVDAAKQDATWKRTLELKGLAFKRSAFGGWTKADTQEAA
jgi:hypothetical protein